MTDYIIAIDPGNCSGHGVLWGVREAKLLCIYDFSKDMQGFLQRTKEIGREYIVIIEDVGHGMPNQSSKATASFAKHVGFLDGWFSCMGCGIDKVLPVTWMKVLEKLTGDQIIGLTPGASVSDSAAKSVRKKAIYEAIKKLGVFNKHIKVANADAFGILIYGTQRLTRQI